MGTPNHHNTVKTTPCDLLDSLAFGDLGESDHLVGGADLDEGELGVFCDLNSQRRFAAVGGT